MTTWFCELIPKFIDPQYDSLIPWIHLLLAIIFNLYEQKLKWILILRMRGTPVIPPRQEFGRRQILAWIRSLFRQSVYKQAQRNSELFRDRFEKHTEFAGSNNTARSNMYPGHRTQDTYRWFHIRGANGQGER